MQTIVVDTDALIALINKEDIMATKALRTLEILYEREVRLLYPATTIVEATTTLQRKLSNSSLVTEIVKMIRASQFEIVAIDQTILEIAETLFKPTGSKQNTLFDAVVAAVAKTVKTDVIFSFDTYYEKIGLRLASNFSEG